MSVGGPDFSAREIAQFERKALQLGLDTSRLLFRRKHETSQQAVNEFNSLIEQSGLVPAAAIWIAEKPDSGEERRAGFNEHAAEYVVGAYESDHVRVRVELAAASASAENLVRILAELLTQQLGRFLTLSRLRVEITSARDQLRLQREELELHKAMTCAQALLVRQGPMSTANAAEYLVGASVRTGRPLLQVANSIVLAYQSSRLRLHSPGVRQGHRQASRFHHKVA